MPSLIPCNFPQSPLPASCQGGLRRPVEPLAAGFGILTPLLKQHFLCWWRGNKTLFLSFFSVFLASQQTGAVCWWVWHFLTSGGKDHSWDWQVLVISWIKALVHQTDPNHICVCGLVVLLSSSASGVLYAVQLATVIILHNLLLTQIRRSVR